tara:strand:+ start:88 stop:930 length:843 start_codon:yes stop_codon:yes gene_type:complete
MKNKMWSASINGKQLAALLNSIKDIVSDVNLDVTEAAMSMQSLDTSHVAMCSFVLHRGLFYDWSFKAPLSIGVNVAGLALALDCLDLSSEGVVAMRYDGHRLCLTSECTHTRSISVNCLSIDIDRLEVPVVPAEAIVMMPSKDFNCMCTDALKLGSNGDFTISKDHVLSIQTRGDLGSSTFTYHNTTDAATFRSQEQVPRALGGKHLRDGSLVVQNSGEFSDSFAVSWRYLHLFSKAKALSNMVILTFVREQPLQITFPIARTFPESSLTFHLAPLFKES